MQHITPDGAMVALLGRQHGCAQVSQIMELGLSRDQIANRVSKGVIERVGRGVVAWPGRPLTLEEKATRALLIAGRGAVAARWTAAALHGLDAPRDPQIHVVMLGRPTAPSRAHAYVHRTRYLPSEHIIQVRGVPTTSLARTLVDCAGLVDRWSALQVLDSANPSSRTWSLIHTTAERLSNGRAGVRAIADATAPDGQNRFRSVLERKAHEALKRYGVPMGEWNVPIGDARGSIREVDVCYRYARLIVEFDGLRYHQRHESHQHDRAMDRRLQIAGWRVLRFTWRDVMHHPEAMAREVLAALGEP